MLTDTRLSIDTRGMIAMLLSRPKNWQIRPTPLAKALGTAGKPIGHTRLRRMFVEAMAHGYMARSKDQARERGGGFGRYVYLVGLPEEVSEEIERQGLSVAFVPHYRNPCTGDPHAGDPHTDNGRTYKIQSSKKIERTNIHTINPASPSPAEQVALPLATDEDSLQLNRIAAGLGKRFAFAGSEPFKAHLSVLGPKRMPPVVYYEGRRGCWFDELYPTGWFDRPPGSSEAK